MEKKNSLKALIVFLVIFIMITLSSCMRAGNFLELALCGAYAVPGMYDADLKGAASPAVLEADEQGRILFEFTHQNSITGEIDTALVICQDIDTEYVYYYEDQCYLYDCNSEEDIALLKSQNDWGLPLDFGKMSVRPNDISMDLFMVPDRILKWKNIQDTINRGLSDLRVTSIESHLLDVNPNGYELYWIKAIANGAETYYYGIIDTDYNIAFLPVENPRIIPDEITVFKNDNGWYSSNKTD